MLLLLILAVTVLMLAVTVPVLVFILAVTVLVLGVMTFVLAFTGYCGYHCTCIYCTCAELDLAYFAYIVQLP